MLLDGKLVCTIASALLTHEALADVQQAAVRSPIALPDTCLHKAAFSPSAIEIRRVFAEGSTS